MYLLQIALIQKIGGQLLQHLDRYEQPVISNYRSVLTSYILYLYGRGTALPLTYLLPTSK